jgi:hypothetical protein
MKEFIVIIGLLSGVLFDSQTGETITGARIDNGKEIVYTDFDGRFPISDTLRIEFISYRDTIIFSHELVSLRELLEQESDKKDSLEKTYLKPKF